MLTSIKAIASQEDRRCNTSLSVQRRADYSGDTLISADERDIDMKKFVKSAVLPVALGAIALGVATFGTLRAYSVQPHPTGTSAETTAVTNESSESAPPPKLGDLFKLGDLGIGNLGL